MRKVNSAFYLDYLPNYVLQGENFKVPASVTEAFVVRGWDLDVRQQTIAKVWVDFNNRGLIEGETDAEKEACFRRLLDSEEEAGFVGALFRQSYHNSMSNASSTTSPEKALLNSERAIARITGLDPIADKEKVLRYVSLDRILMSEDVNDAFYDDDWENPYLEVEASMCESEQQNARRKLEELSALGEAQSEAIALMAEIDEKKRAGISTSTDAIRSKLKRLRKETGWALKPTLLNAN